jgi:predicted dehydrogenase
MKSLIVGMGIGQLYKTVLSNLGHEIITVDSNITTGADLPSVDSAILAHAPFDTVHICTPNFTHFELAAKVAPHSKIVFVEKPGVRSANTWATLAQTFKSTRFMMVKNNMWRENINELRILARESKTVNLDWINKDRVPNPGTWFTTKNLAFGGVSRDLMPHLLSLYMALEPNWRTGNQTSLVVEQNWQLNQLTQTDYGRVDPNGTYDVDDYCRLEFLNNGRRWELTANWRSNTIDKREIEFTMPDGRIKRFELGLCPENAYQTMIADALANIDNDNFWQQQLEQDYWIHERIETL